jgi:glucosamine--fructose-6-phosphate aminotransferase (isomerizing)
MCGIVGYVGRRQCAEVLMEGLARLEYRGYDSAGLALLAPGGALRVHRRPGKLAELRTALPRRLAGRVGIAHTRWATHGEPSERNAHPQTDASGRLAIVHNGIVENAAELRAGLEADGVELRSDTDTECLAHLVARALRDGDGAQVPLEDAVRGVLALIEGTYGLVVLDADQPDRLVAARNGSPVILGVGDGEMLVASDVAALVRHTDRVVALDDGELAVLEAGGYRTLALDATPTRKRAFDVTWSIEQFSHDGHPDFMHKEIHEQPAAIERALRGRLDERFATARLGGVTLDAREVLGIRRVKVLGCGSALYAGMAGAQLIEGLARIPADAEAASEFRYRNPVIERDALYVAVSQSGETADTLAAVQEVRRKGGRVLGVVNVVGSSIARECEGIYLHAGPEVSVASTKAFTSMLVAFALLALHLGRVRDLGASDGARIVAGLQALPERIERVLEDEPAARAVADANAGRSSMFFIGRRGGYPIALEGAQKLKEVSYVHAEAYQASELKHGPLALVSPDFPVVAIVPDDDLFDKNVSSVRQVRARRGPVIGVVQERGLAAQAAAVAAGEPLFDDVLVVPRGEPELDPVLLTIPVQLLAYHAAVALGRDVDQPRNLAKSVTVE